MNISTNYIDNYQTFHMNCYINICFYQHDDNLPWVLQLLYRDYLSLDNELSFVVY